MAPIFFIIMCSSQMKTHCGIFFFNVPLKHNLLSSIIKLFQKSLIKIKGNVWIYFNSWIHLWRVFFSSSSILKKDISSSYALINSKGNTSKLRKKISWKKIASELMRKFWTLLTTFIEINYYSKIEKDLSFSYRKFLHHSI